MATLMYHFADGPQDAAITNSVPAVQGGTPLASPTVTLNGGLAKFDAGSAGPGSFGALITNVAGQVAIYRGRGDVAHDTYSYLIGDVQFQTAIPSEIEAFFTGRHTSGVVFRLAQQITTGRVTLQDSASAVVAEIIPAASILANTKYTFTVRIVRSTGAYTVNYFLGDSTTPVNGSPITGTAAAFGATNPEAFDVGRVAGITNVKTIKVAYVGLASNSTTEIARPSASPSPTAVTITPSDQYPLENATIGFTGTATGATATSITCIAFPAGASSPAISNGNSLSTCTAVLSSQGQYTFQLRATNTNPTPTDATVIVYVHPATGVAVKVRGVTPGAYTNEGGAPDLVTAANDGSDTTLAQTPDAPVGATIRYQMNPYGDGPIKNTVKVKESGGDVKFQYKFYKEDGTTAVFTSTVQDLTTTGTLVDVVIDPAGMTILGTAKSDRRALFFDVIATL